MAVKKTFVFQNKDAQAIASLLQLLSPRQKSYRLRLNSILEWAVYLRDDPHPDASSSSVERPRFNEIHYEASANRLEISGDYFDKNTGIPAPPDLLRYYFFSPPLLLNEAHTNEWWKLIETIAPSKLVKDENNLYAETVVQKKIKLESSDEFEIKILLVWDYTQNIKRPALQVGIGIEAK
ncbi:MAG: hypothetical protein HQM15_05835 [Deltaproteobacteria bacterium]|nr:hypothetical protein [Deltaproteobacteria bacterium]